MRKLFETIAYVLGAALLILWAVRIIIALTFAISTLLATYLVRWRLKVYNKSSFSELEKMSKLQNGRSREQVL